MVNSNRKKIVLTIGGHDPSGGAGIQADVERITAAGCHAVSVISALTLQDSRKVADINVQNADNFSEQLQLILDDMPVAACKVGLLGSADLVNVVCDELSSKSIPLVLDPIIQSGSGSVLSDEMTCSSLLQNLMPMSTVVTPNSDEARQLSGEADLQLAAEKLLDAGANSVLITGTHEQTENVVNTLYLKSEFHEYVWPRLPHIYHGSGCTLASRIAARLALGDDVKTAIEKAQDYTWHTLKHAYQPGKGQWNPDRLYQAENPGEL